MVNCSFHFEIVKNIRARDALLFWMQLDTEFLAYILSGGN